MSSLSEIPQNVITKIILEAIEQLDISNKISVEEDFVKALSRAANLFIVYVTSKANSIASENNRKTVYAQDVFDAITSVGLGCFLAELTEWHSAFVEEKEKCAGEKAAKKKKEKSTDQPAEGAGSQKDQQLQDNVAAAMNSNMDED